MLSTLTEPTKDARAIVSVVGIRAGIAVDQVAFQHVIDEDRQFAGGGRDGFGLGPLTSKWSRRAQRTVQSFRRGARLIWTVEPELKTIRNDSNRRNSGDEGVAALVDVGTGVERASSETHGNRGFTDVDLRRMLEYASDHRGDILEGRFVIDVKHAGRAWEIIVEPDDVRKLLVVITAYPVEQS